MNTIKDKMFDIFAEYNPKLEYLICKNIANNFPEKYDEIHVRNCYKGYEKPQNNAEENMCLIKEFLMKENINEITYKNLEVFYSEKLHGMHKIDLDFINSLKNNDEDLISSIIKLFSVWNEFDENNSIDIIFRFAFVILCLQKEKKIVVPYKKPIDMIKQYIKHSGGNKVISYYIKKLIQRTEDNNIKHDIALHETINKNLYRYKDEFIYKFNAKYIALVGSFARDSANEYSDLDMIVVMRGNYIENSTKLKALEFWKNHIPIKMDITIVCEQNLNYRLTSAMKETFRKL